MPRSSRSGQRELSRFERDIIADHANAAEDATNFDVQWETQSYPCNCIAWAIGVQNRQITPQTMAQLNWEYNKTGYFDVADDSYFAVGDVEVYAGSSGEPVHAHQIIDTPEGREGVWASSKMGAGPVIEHPRDMLDSPKRNRPDRYVYGHIRRWFRTNPEKHAAFLAENFKTTSTGRTIPKTESEKQADKEAARRQSTRETQREPSPHRTRSGREWTDAEQYSYGYKTKSGRSHRSSRYYDDDRYGESLYGGKDYDRSEATYQPAVYSRSRSRARSRAGDDDYSRARSRTRDDDYYTTGPTSRAKSRARSTARDDDYSRTRSKTRDDDYYTTGSTSRAKSRARSRARDEDYYTTTRPKSRARDEYQPEYYTTTSRSRSRAGDYTYDYQYDDGYDYGRSGYYDTRRGSYYYTTDRGIDGPDGAPGKPQFDLEKHKKTRWFLACCGLVLCCKRPQKPNGRQGPKETKTKGCCGLLFCCKRPQKPEGQQVPQEAKGPKKAKTKGCYRLLCCWGRGKQKQQGQKTSQAPQTTQAPHAPDAREATKAPEAPKPAQAPQATKTPQPPQGQKDAKAPQAPKKA
ncbi:hypothetical protein V8F33_009162 [Rhypophila sp. PSN 637]